ncbi:MAG TPA: signal peptidase I [Candidatus Magasanikbacteria bacterium]|nr:signal peptidase I [Candidatus Magasanikbacteria bacterium]
MKSPLSRMHEWINRRNRSSFTPQSGMKLFIIEVFKVGLFTILTIFVVRTFLFKPFYVRGASMETNFFDSEYLIIDEVSYRVHEPKRGDVIVFRYPNDPSEYFLKRVIGLPGETVTVRNGQVVVINKDFSNGIVLNEAYLRFGLRTPGDTTATMKEGQYFVMGDNRPASWDSRGFGPINGSAIVGRVWVRGWPFDRAQAFSTPNYQLK